MTRDAYRTETLTARLSIPNVLILEIVELLNIFTRDLVLTHFHLGWLGRMSVIRVLGWWGWWCFRPCH